MKKLIVLLVVMGVFILGGCGLIEEANDSLDYVNKSTEYLNDLSTFAEDASSMNGEELQSSLQSLQGTIENFMAIDPPALAEGIHKQLEDKSQILLDTTNNVLQNGEVAIEQLEQSELFKTINNITSLMDQIEQLGL